MEIRFFEIKQIDLTEGLMKGRVEIKGEPKGVVKVKGGKLYIKVKDKELKNILNQPYTVRIRKRGEKGSLIIERKTYQPGDIEHIKTIAEHCWEFGYLAKIKK